MTVHHGTAASEEGPLIVIASNRGPFSFERNSDGTFTSKRGAGGLVTALGALVEKHDVLWVAAALSEGDEQWASQQGTGIQNVEGIDLRLVLTDSEQYARYYNVIANPLLWFIQHQLWDTPRQPSIDAAIWEAWHDGYVPINRQFAEVIAESVKQARGSSGRPVIIFPQDYHLYLVPKFLRKLLGSSAHIQPFIHIPWPGPDAWRILPTEMRNALLSSLLAADRVGFQTTSDAFNFVQTCRFYLPDAHSHGSRDSIEYKGHLVVASTYPISIDVEKLETLAEANETRLLKSQLITLIGDRRLILRTDRIEPSKNILRGLLAYRTLLEAHPEYLGKVQMLALLVPSRMEVDEYQDYLQEIMAEAGMINARFSDDYWEPVRIILGDNYARAIAAMQLYDVLLVNPIADGMNLVAKEGVLVNQRDGVLLLSEHAGAFYELGHHALTVSPFDVYGTAETIHRALTMKPEERRKRAESLRATVREASIVKWFTAQVDDALTTSRSAARSASTPGTPSTRKSAASRTESGVPSESTPTPSA